MTVTVKKRTPSSMKGSEIPGGMTLAEYIAAGEPDHERAEQREREFNIFFARLTSAAEDAGFADPLKWVAQNGVSAQSIRNLRTDKKPPGLTILQRLSKASGKSINWWLGEEEAFSTEEFVFIPRYKPSEDSASITMAFRRYWVEKYLKADPNALTVYRVEDDAMAGTFNPADNVLIHGKSIDAMRDGLYALLINGAMVVRRVQALPNNIIRVMPDNPKYPSFEVNLNDDSGVEVVGVPVWYSRQI
jgi:phage repressor protein C with HTH and peptisase S24 domain